MTSPSSRWLQSTLLRASVRYSLLHPWQFGLSILGIALGVAVVVSIEISSASAKRAFELSSQAVTGRTTHQIIAGSSGFDERLYPKIRRLVPQAEAAPVVEGHVTIPGLPGRAFVLLGVDPLADGPFRTYLERVRVSSDFSPRTLMIQPGSVLVSSEVAEALLLNAGDPLDLKAAGRIVTAQVVGVLTPDDELSRQLQADLLITDIATAQELLNQVGRLDRIDLILPQANRVLLWAQALPPEVRLVSAEDRFNVTGEMTRAFNLNLVMLSLLALLVGMFLIYNTVSFSVVQRRHLLGNLRALGVTRGQIFRLILAEAALLGLVGSLIGVALGIALSSELVKLVSQTINDLYFVLNVRDVSVPAAILVKGMLLGLVAALVAASVPAFEATSVAPRVALLRSVAESRMQWIAPRAALAGLALIIASSVLGLVPSGDLGIGFSGLFALVMGFALLTPFATILSIRAVRPLAGALSPSLGPLTVQGVATSLSRTAVAIAALMVALAAGAGVGVMVDSFRRNVSEWLASTLRADVYVSLPNPGGATIDPRIIAALTNLGAIEHISMRRTIETQSSHGPVEVLVLKMAPESYRGFKFLEGDRKAGWRAFDEAGAVLVSEPYAWRHRVHPGDEVGLLTDHGEQVFTIKGVVRDYGSEQGVVIMSHRTFGALWRDQGFTTLGLYAVPETDIPQLMEAARAAIGGRQDLLIRSNVGIREASLEVFDRTFTITIVLRILATAVAFVGVLSAFMVLQLERVREVAVLRALGLTRGQVWGMVGAQTGLMGIIIGVLAIPLGLGMALMLILVINRRSFGWSMDIHIDPAIIGQTLLLAIVAALIAGLYPAYKMTQTEPALALREE